jgi:hypothetical protein
MYEHPLQRAVHRSLGSRSDAHHLSRQPSWCPAWPLLKRSPALSPTTSASPHEANILARFLHWLPDPALVLPGGG